MGRSFGGLLYGSSTDEAYMVQVKFTGSQIPFHHEFSNLQSVDIDVNSNDSEVPKGG